MKGANIKWQIRVVQAEQAGIQAELKELEATAGASGALHFALRQIQLLEEEGGAREALRRLLYILETLSLHQRGGGLKPQQIRDAVILARGLLTAAGVHQGSSRLAFLHAELHLLLSQIQRQKGQHLASAWEQQAALQEVRRTPTDVQGQHMLAMGQRALRLGHAGLALSYFITAIGALPAGKREAAWLGRIRAHRLAGDSETAAYMRKLFVAGHHPSAVAKRFLIWEEACLELSASGAPERLLKCIKRHGSHHDNRHLLEASLWVKALPQREWMDRVLLVRSLGRRRRDKAKTQGRLYKVALALENCYEPAAPLAVRLEQLGKTLLGCQLLLGIEHELLAWAAAARFLARHNTFDLAALTLLEYTALSRKLSQGQTADVLGIMRDMLERPWFTAYNL